MKILRSEKERALKVYLPDLQSVRPQDRNRNFFSGKKSVNFFIFFQFLFFYSRFSSFKDVRARHGGSVLTDQQQRVKNEKNHT
jgi:hypothetical protein